jgi:hypothetical protein
MRFHHLSANSMFGSGAGVHAGASVYSYSPRPLVEECLAIRLADLRRAFGRKELLKAAEDARPLRLVIQGNCFSVYLLAQTFWPPRHNRVLSDRQLKRLWLVCPACRRRVRTLYAHPKLPEPNVFLAAQCRTCRGLVYQSQNCGKNRWWREIARPLKRLLRRRRQLLARKPSPKIAAQIDLISQSISLLRLRAAPKTRAGSRKTKTRAGPAARIRRPYRDVSLIR